MLVLQMRGIRTGKGTHTSWSQAPETGDEFGHNVRAASLVSRAFGNTVIENFSFFNRGVITVNYRTVGY